MKYKKKRLTDTQYQIYCRQKYDSKITDNLLKECGLNPQTFATMAIELVQAQFAIVELQKNYSTLLTEKHMEVIEKFNSKLALTKKCDRLKPTLAYPILNLTSKIKRQAHKQEKEARQKIQAQRYNQP
jgi:hypothetical protein